MAYSLYKLNFTTGLHVGLDTGGASLDDGQMLIHSDTLFSALCCECRESEELRSLYEYFAKGKLTISGTLPYRGDEYFFPKPVMPPGNGSRKTIDVVSGKEFKKIQYVPVSLFHEYMETIAGTKEIDPNLLQRDFGMMSTIERVAINGHTQPQPYFVATWHFYSDAGLYIILDYKDQQAHSLFTEKLLTLGYAGVGGKRSSGLGKFKVEERTVPQQMLKMLEDDGADYQMLLGTALPNESRLKNALDGGWYTVQRRGGFVQSEKYAVGQLKKRTIFMLGPGSCLRNRFDGEMFDLADGGSHPVWRCGKTLFAGVRV